MMRKRISLAACVLAVCFGAAGFAQNAATSAPTSMPGNPALRESSRGGWWMTKHEAVLERNKKGDVELVFLGDSITQNYEKHQPPHQDFLPTWEKFYGDRHAENLGYSGDTTGNLLWRLDHGEMDGIMPKVAVIMIGTNNTSMGQTTQQVWDGIDAVVAKVHEKAPATKVLLLGILPTELPVADKSPTDAAINAGLKAEFAESEFVTVLDIGPIFYKDGKLDWSLFYDPTLPPQNGKPRGPLHPDTVGQRMMAEAIEPTLAKLMGDASKVETGAATRP